jgi:hypothetical protein
VPKSQSKRATSPHASSPSPILLASSEPSGDLDRITAWLRVFAMVNVAPEFNQTPLVTNGYSDLILELYGPEVGMHARSSIGMKIPLNAPVNCEAEVEIDG